MAAVDYFLKLEGITGESTAAGHKGEIDVMSWSWGATHTATTAAGGGAGGKVSVQDFHFTMHSSKASPQLLESSVMGKFIKLGILTGQKQNVEGKSEPFMKYTLTEVLVSSFDNSAAGAGQQSDVPMDQITLNFVKLDFEFEGAKASFDVRSFHK